MNQVIILMKVWMILRIKIMNLQSKRITQSDNYNVWSVYLKEGVNTFKISVPNEDAENVIAKLEGSLLINEIGQGTYANSIKIPNDGWYRLEITAINRYSWKFE